MPYHKKIPLQCIFSPSKTVTQLPHRCHFSSLNQKIYNLFYKKLEHEHDHEMMMIITSAVSTIKKYGYRGKIGTT